MSLPVDFPIWPKKFHAATLHISQFDQYHFVIVFTYTLNEELNDVKLSSLNTSYLEWTTCDVLWCHYETEIIRRNEKKLKNANLT